MDDVRLSVEPPPTDDCGLVRVNSLGTIEKRAVSAAFLQAFTKSKCEAPRFCGSSLAQTCTKEGIAYLSNRIEELVAKQKEQNSTAIGEPTRTSRNSWSEASLDETRKETDRQLVRLQFCLKERKREVCLTTRDVHRCIIKKDTDALCCRYLELPEWCTGTDPDSEQPYVGTADYFVSHSWDSPWQALVDAVCEHSNSFSYGERKPYYWVDIFAVNQHSPKPPNSGAESYCTGDIKTCVGCQEMQEDLPDWTKMESSHDVGFEKVIKTTKKTLFVMEPWYNPRPPTRAWCLYESYLTLCQKNGELIVSLGKQQQRNMQLALQNEFGTIESMISQLDARTADVTVENDKNHIFGAIEQMKGGFSKLNKSLRTPLQVWLAGCAIALLQRIDPNRRPMTQEEIRAEAEEHGEVLARVTQVLDFFPGLPMVLLTATVCHFSVWVSLGMASMFAGSDVRRFLFDNLMATMVLFAITWVLEGHQRNHQLRRFSTLCKCFSRNRGCCESIFTGCWINYGFPILCIIGFLLLGGPGFGYMVPVVLITLLISGYMSTQTELGMQELKCLAGMLLLQAGQVEVALPIFESTTEMTEKLWGPERLYSINMQVGHIMALHQSGRTQEAAERAADCLGRLDDCKSTFRYALEHCCSESGGSYCLWVSRLAKPFDIIDYAAIAYTKACVLAANQDEDASVLSALHEALELGYTQEHKFPEREKCRFVHNCYAFAALTSRADANTETGKLSLAQLEQMLNDNNKQRKVLKRKRLLVFLFFLVCFLAVIVVIMEYARVLRCSSTEGGWLRIDGCPTGSFCAEDFLCKHCANAMSSGHCRALGSCCSKAFLENCWHDPANCSGTTNSSILN